MVCINHENKTTTKIKHTKYILRQIIITHIHIASQLFSTRQSLLQYLQVTHGKRVTTFCSVSDELSIFTATIRAYNVLWLSFASVVHQELCSSHKHSKLFVLCVLFFVSHKYRHKISWLSYYTKIFLHEKINIRKSYYTKISRPTV